ncbi:glycosyltransferase family 39 protein [Dapis sp. BLCC M172]|uniref:glycosyltransferase family 39 protein n=1 Tax=Dapis sp. BLCC M172 TaxID=2975281 RepID=UPI003CF58B7A
MIILPILSLVLIFAKLLTQKNDWRDSFFKAIVLWGLILTIITELLSLFGLFQYFWVIAAWLLIDCLYVFLLTKSSLEKHTDNLKRWSKSLLGLSPMLILLLTCITIIVFLIGINAIVAAPNHSDSMEYHLPRIYYWIQNNTVAHYPTYNLFHLYQNPWSEFAMAHFQILNKSDRFVNTIQWGSMVMSILGVSILAKQLGGNIRDQILASVFAVTIPMGILQASGTNNDLVVTFWLICFVYFTFLTLENGISKSNILFLGCSLGLAILTKGTAYIYAFPFCIWLLLWGIKNLKWQAIKPIVIILLIVLAINLGHYLRNYALFDSVLGMAGTGETNKELGVLISISGILKHLSLHADIVRNLQLEKIISPTTGLTSKVLEIIHGVLGIDLSDPALTSPKARRFYVPGLSTNEDVAGNPLHLLLIIGSFFVLTFNKKIWTNKLLIKYGIVLVLGFILFASLLTWSPYRCRLHLPLFILFSPLVAIVFSKSFPKQVSYFLAILVLFLSYKWVLFNSVRPLIGENNIFQSSRVEQYFQTQPKYQQFYLDEVVRVESNQCKNIGLTFKNSSFEYPLLVLLNENDPKQIQHINVENESQILVKKDSNSNFQNLSNDCIINIDRSQLKN